MDNNINIFWNKDMKRISAFLFTILILPCIGAFAANQLTLPTVYCPAKTQCTPNTKQCVCLDSQGKQIDCGIWQTASVSSNTAPLALTDVGKTFGTDNPATCRYIDPVTGYENRLTTSAAVTPSIATKKWYIDQGVADCGQIPTQTNIVPTDCPLGLLYQPQ